MTEIQNPLQPEDPIGNPTLPLGESPRLFRSPSLAPASNLGKAIAQAIELGEDHVGITSIDGQRNVTVLTAILSDELLTAEQSPVIVLRLGQRYISRAMANGASHEKLREELDWIKNLQETQEEETPPRDSHKSHLFDELRVFIDKRSSAETTQELPAVRTTRTPQDVKLITLFGLAALFGGLVNIYQSELTERAKKVHAVALAILNDAVASSPLLKALDDSISSPQPDLPSPTSTPTPAPTNAAQLELELNPQSIPSPELEQQPISPIAAKISSAKKPGNPPAIKKISGKRPAHHHRHRHRTHSHRRHGKR